MNREPAGPPPTQTRIPRTLPHSRFDQQRFVSRGSIANPPLTGSAATCEVLSGHSDVSPWPCCAALLLVCLGLCVAYALRAERGHAFLGSAGVVSQGTRSVRSGTRTRLHWPRPITSRKTRLLCGIMIGLASGPTWHVPGADSLAVDLALKQREGRSAFDS